MIPRTDLLEDQAAMRLRWAKKTIRHGKGIMLRKPRKKHKYVKVSAWWTRGR